MAPITFPSGYIYLAPPLVASSRLRPLTGIGPDLDLNGNTIIEGGTTFPDDGFVLGQTMPTNVRSVSGSAGFRYSEASLKNYSGSFTNVTAGEKITGLAITGRFKCQTADVLLQDCLILQGLNPAGPSTGTKGVDAVVRDWYAIDCTSTGCKNFQARHVEVRPSTPTVDCYGVSGRNYDLYRCMIGGVTDGLSPAGATNIPPEQQYWSVRGTLIYDLRAYANDPRQTDGAHGDGCQAQGRTTSVHPASGMSGMVGCRINGGGTSCVLLQTHYGSYGPIFFDDNWFFGAPAGGATINIADGGIAISQLYMRRNRFSNTGRISSQNATNKTYGSLWLMSAATYDAAGRLDRQFANIILETGAEIQPIRFA